MICKAQLGLRPSTMRCEQGRAVGIIARMRMPRAVFATTMSLYPEIRQPRRAMRSVRRRQSLVVVKCQVG